MLTLIVKTPQYWASFAHTFLFIFKNIYYEKITII